MSDELFPVEREILDALNKKAEELWAKKASRPEWTREFTAVIKCAGEQREMKVYYAGGKKAGKPGWFWDLCWLSEGQSWQDFRGVKLACEIEWKHSNEHILEDFLKLVVADAELRVFVFAVKKSEDVESKFHLLRNACPGSKGHRYLAICFPDGGNTPVPYRAWTI